MDNNGAFKNILVAYDGSADSKKAVKAACGMTKKYGAKLTLIHVYSAPLYVYGGPGGLPPVSIDRLEEAAAKHAKDVAANGVAEAEGSGVRPRAEVVESGSTVEAIIDYSLGEKVDLIVIGTRGLTGFRKLLLGSVSSGVVNHAKCPVLVVR